MIALHSRLWKMTIYYCCIPLLLLQVQSEYFRFMIHISHITFGQWKSSIQLEKKRSLKYLYIQENHFIPGLLLLDGVRTNFFPAAVQDYHEVSPRIVHFPGEAPHTSMQCITINILDDEEFKGQETWVLFSQSLCVRYCHSGQYKLCHSFYCGRWKWWRYVSGVDLKCANRQLVLYSLYYTTSSISLYMVVHN